jgi:phosphatidylglycerol lysyltransferase
MVTKVNSASVRARALAALPVVIGLAVFVTALEVLRLELHTVSWHEVSSDVLSIPLPGLLLALGITACNYLVLAGYDVLAFKYVGRAVALGPVVGVSMLAYAVANSVGFAMLSGASIRYRFYSRWGVTADKLSRIVFSYSITFWLGLLALGGFALVRSPLPGLAEWSGHQYVPAAGWTLMLLVARGRSCRKSSPSPTSPSTRAPAKPPAVVAPFASPRVNTRSWNSSRDAPGT